MDGGYPGSDLSIQRLADIAYYNIRAELDVDQASVVELPFEAISATSANAGAGKTRTVMGRLLRLIGTGHDPRSVAAVTFTRKATSEIKARYAEATNDEPEKSLKRVRPPIGTGHSFGIRLLTRHFGANMVSLSESQRRRLIRDLPTFQRVGANFENVSMAIDSLAGRAETCMLVWAEFDGAGRLLAVHNVDDAARGIGSDLAFRDDFAEVYTRAAWYTETAASLRIRQKPPILTKEIRALTLHRHADISGLEPADFLKLLTEYVTAKYQSGTMDFGDMLSVPMALMLQHESLRGRARSTYKHFLIDEAQDLSAADFALIFMVAGFPDFARRWPHDRSIVMVGDSKQSLYWWRNGMPLVLDNLDRYLDFPLVQFTALRRNFRSRPGLVHVCNSFGHSFDRRHIYDSEPMREEQEGPLIEIKDDFPTTNQESKAITQRIVDLHATGLAWEKIAILTRRNLDLDRVQAALITAQIPYQMRKNRRLSSSSAFGFVNSLLSVAANPRNSLAASHIALSLHGIGEKSIPALQASLTELLQADLVETVETAVGRIQSKAAGGLQALFKIILPELRQLLDGDTMQDVIRRLSHIFTVRCSWKDSDSRSGIRMSLDKGPVLHVLQLVSQVIEILEEDSEFLNASATAQLRDVCNALALADESEEEGSTPEGVILTTMHGFKGGEADYVFAVHLTPERPIRLSDPDADGERCTFNVAVTRARQFLWLSASRKILVQERWRGMPANPFLTEFKDKFLQWDQEERRKRLGVIGGTTSATTYM